MFLNQFIYRKEMILDFSMNFIYSIGMYYNFTKVKILTDIVFPCLKLSDYRMISLCIGNIRIINIPLKQKLHFNSDF